MARRDTDSPAEPHPAQPAAATAPRSRGPAPVISRRGVLAGAAAVLAVARLRAQFEVPAAGAAPLPTDPFTLGVASGDPLPDSVVLWTRLAPDPTAGGGMPPGDVPVSWQVATDATFTDVVASGTEPAITALAHSVHVTVGGLVPDRWYHYRFSVDGYTSPGGRTRTTPAPRDRTPLRLGAASCQNWRAGYYTAHAHLAAEGCDLVVFLGDYIYESGGSGPVRDHGSPECMTLTDYRNRYGLYKGDPDLQAAHAACPWLVTWDDHEVENNYAGLYPQDPADGAIFPARRAAAYQAWYEHQPVRLDAPSGSEYPIHRRLDWGGLARIHLPDTRQFRSDQACGNGLASPCVGYDDPARTLLGDAQETWLLDSFATSTAVWDVFAQQIVFAPMPFAARLNMDQWDGYPAQRDRVWPVLRTKPNPVVLSGDIHFGAVGQLHDTLNRMTTPRRGTELVVGSISSQFTETGTTLIKTVVENIPWWDYVNAADRGYMVIDLSETTMHAALRVVSTALSPTATVRTDHEIDVVAVPVAVPVDPTTTTTSTSSTTSPTGPVPSAAPPAVPVVARPGFIG